MKNIQFGMLGGNPIVGIDVVTLSFFVQELSAMLLQEIPNMPVKSEEEPTKGAGAILREKVNWAPHGFTYSLQTVVEFIYEAIPMLFAPGTFHIVGEKEARLIAEAMEAYQRYKAELIDEEQKVMGKDWGNSSEFNKKDWTDRNFMLT